MNSVIDYTIIEKNFKQNVPFEETGEFVVPGKLEGNKSKKNVEKQKNGPKEITPEERIKQKQKKIMKNYDIILSLKSWLTVKLAMNQPEPVESVEEEEPEVEPVKQGGKGKKK